MRTGLLTDCKSNHQAVYFVRCSIQEPHPFVETCAPSNFHSAHCDVCFPAFSYQESIWDAESEIHSTQLNLCARKCGMRMRNRYKKSLSFQLLPSFTSCSLRSGITDQFMYSQTPASCGPKCDILQCIRENREQSKRLAGVRALSTSFVPGSSSFLFRLKICSLTERYGSESGNWNWESQSHSTSGFTIRDLCCVAQRCGGAHDAEMWDL